MKPRKPGTVSVILLRPIVVCLAQDGVAVDEFLAAIGVTRAQLGDQDAMFDARLIQRAWDEASERARDPAFGLHVGERIHPGSYDLLDYLGMSSSCFRETIDRLARYYRLLSENAEIGYEPGVAVSRLVHRPRVGPPEEWRHAWECFLSAAVAHARRALGREWKPVAVELMHAAPADVSEHARIFRAPVRFEQPVNALVFETVDAERPLPTADPVLARLLTAVAEELASQIPDPDSLVGRARAAIVDELRGGNPSLERIAEVLHVSRRTLQRKLEEAGTSHHALLDDCRRALALQYLKHANLALGEIAFLLGFSQPNAFHRAFRRWMGATPAVYRESLKAP